MNLRGGGSWVHAQEKRFRVHTKSEPLLGHIIMGLLFAFKLFSSNELDL